MKHRIIAFICSIAAAFTASAQVPSLINYQGRLTDSNGAPVTGSKNFAISIYDAATAGNLLYEETIGAVTLDANGVYSFQFGSAGSSTSQVTETIGTTDDTNLTYTKTLTNTPVVNNSITVTDGTNSWSQSVGNPGVGATAKANTISGFVIGATITNGGSGYTSAPSVTITGAGTGATATATLTNGVVTGITITSAGSGYTGAVTITIAPPVIPFRVDYSSGAITATYSSAPAAGRTITATYLYSNDGISGALSSGAEHWMTITVAGVPQGTRQRILAVPYALTAEQIKSSNVDINLNNQSINIKSGGISFADGSIQIESFSKQADILRASILETKASIAATQSNVKTSSLISNVVAEGFQNQLGSQSLVAIRETSAKHVNTVGYTSGGTDGNYISIPTMEGGLISGSFSVFYTTPAVFSGSYIQKITFDQNAYGGGGMEWYFRYNYIDESSASTTPGVYGNGYGKISSSTNNPFPQKPVKKIEIIGRRTDSGMASKRLRAFSLAHANLATTNSGSVQESRSGVMRGREMPDDEAIQTFVQFLFLCFGNYFWQTVYIFLESVTVLATNRACNIS